MANILLIDDEADMRLALSNVLSRGGHSVEEAPDGPAGLARLSRGGIDAALLDIRMPGMDGVQVLRKIRETDGALPVIMVTGYGNVDSAVEVMQLGASHYLAKPFSNKELLETVNSVLQAGHSASEGLLRKRLEDQVSARPPASAPEPPPEPEIPEPSRRPARLVPALGALVVGAVAAALVWLGRAGPARSFELPYSHPTALVWVGESLWTADWFSQTVYEQRISGAKVEVVRAVKLPQTHITGLAVAGGSLYLTDSWRKVIERRRLDAALTLIETLPSPGSNPSGLFWDGRYLWSSDSSSARFYQHDLDRALSVLASYKTPGRTPAGMYRDSQYFWSADADTRLLYQHRLDKELRIVGKFGSPMLDEGSQGLSCFTWRDGMLWFARDGVGRLFREPLPSFKKIPL